MFIELINYRFLYNSYIINKYVTNYSNQHYNKN